MHRVRGAAAVGAEGTTTAGAIDAKATVGSGNGSTGVEGINTAGAFTAGADTATGAAGVGAGAGPASSDKAIKAFGTSYFAFIWTIYPRLPV